MRALETDSGMVAVIGVPPTPNSRVESGTGKMGTRNTTHGREHSRGAQFLSTTTTPTGVGLWKRSRPYDLTADRDRPKVRAGLLPHNRRSRSLQQTFAP